MSETNSKVLNTQLEEVLNGKALCFDRRSCRYNVDKCRESTGRVVVWREFETIRSYTMESSFCGMDKGSFTVSWYKIFVIMKIWYHEIIFNVDGINLICYVVKGLSNID